MACAPLKSICVFGTALPLASTAVIVGETRWPASAITMRSLIEIVCAGPAMVVTLNATGAAPANVAVAVFTPTLGSVTKRAAARPCASVITVAGDTEPAPAVTTNDDRSRPPWDCRRRRRRERESSRRRASRPPIDQRERRRRRATRERRRRRSRRRRRRRASDGAEERAGDGRTRGSGRSSGDAAEGLRSRDQETSPEDQRGIGRWANCRLSLRSDYGVLQIPRCARDDGSASLG